MRTKESIGQEVTKHVLECKLERARSGTILLETGMGTGEEKSARKKSKKDRKKR